MTALRVIEWAGYTLACWVVASLLLFLMYLPAFPAEAKCVITKDQFFRFVQQTGDYREASEMPPKFLRGFINAFNESPPKSGLADSVTVFQHKEIPLLRVVFSKGKCFTNMFDMPIPAFLGLLKKSQGDSI